MKKKWLILATLSFIVILWGCQNPDSISQQFPSQLDAEEAVNAIINARGPEYDYLNDEAFMKQLELVATKIAERESRHDYVITYGLLGENSIPEIAIYLQRDIFDKEDPGELLLLQYKNHAYQVVSRESMNYDNENEIFLIGPVSYEKQGLFIMNKVSTHSGCTYLYGMNKGRLEPLIKDRKINMFSAYPTGQVKDINDDGLLEWSIVVYNPDSMVRHTAVADTMDIWYQWDGKNSAKVVDVDRKMSFIRIDDEIYLEAKNKLIEDPGLFIPYMKTNMPLINKQDTNELVQTYIEYLYKEAPAQTERLAQILKHIEDSPDKALLSIDWSKVNMEEYLSHPRTLAPLPEFKNYLLSNFKEGLYLNTETTPMTYDINYPMLQDLFGRHVFRELDDYFTIRSYEYLEPTLTEWQRLSIDLESLAERIIMTDNFIVNYPYSPLQDYVKVKNEWYVRTFFFGTKEDPAYYVDSLMYRPEVLAVFDHIIDEYPFSFLSENVRFFIENLHAHKGKINDQLYDYINREYDIEK